MEYLTRRVQTRQKIITILCLMQAMFFLCTTILLYCVVPINLKGIEFFFFKLNNLKNCDKRKKNSK